jgi:hypothetical protein
VIKTAVLLATAALVTHVADAIPKLDVAAVCRATTDTPSDKSKIKSCMDSEQRTREQLAANWKNYSAASRAQCSNEMASAYHASYTELVSCLEMANPEMMKSPASTSIEEPPKSKLKR